MDQASVKAPLDVPADRRNTWTENYRLMTRNSGRLFLMAGDQKVEHLNDDFHGHGIDPEDSSPEHLFRIAAASPVGCFATQLGLIARYGATYPDIPYLVKINSKSHLVKTAQRDPVSRQWQTMEQVAGFVQSSGLHIVGVGYTIYPGSDFEPEMLSEASRLINDAHRMGMVVVIWAYPRGKAVTREQDPHLVAGAAGVAACLGADFVKVNPPLSPEGVPEGHLLAEAVKAAGRTGVVCAGGHETTPDAFLSRLHEQIHEGGTVGCATGRNVHQRSLEEAISLCKAIHAVAISNETPREALRFFQKKH